ncbi:LLM class flavin-dependent oxidoreductase [Nakamurella sp. YIM 132087]|uniref:LLM class flavin-dependent oxidoreductase n=1 Tax=Nakamurella alba TaxID=2665158 RepID=A0A7K1FH66_9ACTN|nr:LLM class flavin-dependent oxidoreductase [Nakamurella alba]MTD13420.1 LLM class flavin-dependent oxidoreductase [Nakamurella alba]
MRLGFLVDTDDRIAYGARGSAQDAVLAMEGMIAEAVAAEQAGFHTLAVPDRHGIADCAFPGPEQLLTVLARETERVAIGSFTLVSTLTHPLKVAEQLAVVDQLSRGRLFVTASRGFLPSFWDQFGAPQDHLLGRYTEALALWRAAMPGERFDFHGRYWDTTNGLLAPPPYQPGGWPIWGGGNVSPAAIARAADLGDAWTCDNGPLDLATWNRHVGVYRERAEALGKRPYVVLLRDAWVADTNEQAMAEFGGHLLKEVRFYLRKGTYAHHPGFTEPDDATVENLFDHVVVGDPQRCRDQIERFRTEFGVDQVILRPRFPGGPDRTRVLEQIARLGAEVVRPVQERFPAPDHPAVPIGARW